MTSYVALLRGINVGGNKSIPMARLKSLFESLGFAPARTHLNSGNVIFAAEGKAGTLARLIGDAIKAEFGFRPAVVLRSAAELKRVVAKNPFGDTAARDRSHLLVMALDGKPMAGAKAALAEAYSGPEQIEIVGADVYITYPNGIGRSKLTNALLEKHLGVAGTARNWNTVVKVLELAEAIGKG